MVDRKHFAGATDIQVDFCDPHHRWHGGFKKDT